MGMRHSNLRLLENIEKNIVAQDFFYLNMHNMNKKFKICRREDCMPCFSIFEVNLLFDANLPRFTLERLGCKPSRVLRKWRTEVT